MTGAEVAVGLGVASLLAGTASAVHTYQQQEEAKDDIKDAEKKAEEEAQRIANANADRIEAETAEELRRVGNDRDRAASRLKAKLASTGVRGVSPQSYIDAFLSERDREIDWIRTSGQSRADLTRSSVNTAKSNPQGGSLPQLFSSATNAFSSGYSWYDRYVKTTP